MSGFVLRDFTDADKPQCCGFIDALQVLEQPFTKDRRLDGTVGLEYCDQLLEKARTQNGRVIVAEADGRVIGWVVVYTSDQSVFVEESLRRYGYISELYVEPEWHGSGVGQALLAAGEEHLRGTGVKYLLIGVVAGNQRAQAAYRKAGFEPYAHDLRKWL